jgi:hypothetical protein
MIDRLNALIGRISGRDLRDGQGLDKRGPSEGSSYLGTYLNNMDKRKTDQAFKAIPNR